MSFITLITFMHTVVIFCFSYYGQLKKISTELMFIDNLFNQRLWHKGVISSIQKERWYLNLNTMRDYVLYMYICTDSK